MSIDEMILAKLKSGLERREKAELRQIVEGMLDILWQDENLRESLIESLDVDFGNLPKSRKKPRKKRKPKSEQEPQAEAPSSEEPEDDAILKQLEEETEVPQETEEPKEQQKVFGNEQKSEKDRMLE